MFVPSVAMRAVVGSDDGLLMLHVPRQRDGRGVFPRRGIGLGSSGGGTGTVGIVSAVGLEAAWAQAGAAADAQAPAPPQRKKATDPSQPAQPPPTA